MTEATSTEGTAAVARGWAGLIDAPPRATLAVSAGTSCVVALVALGNVVPRSWVGWVTLALAVSAALAFTLRAPLAGHAALVGALLYGVRIVPVVGDIFPLNVGVTLALYLAVVLSIPGARRTAGWLRRGTLDRTTVLAVVGFAATSAVALAVWRYTTHADLTRFRSFVPDVPLWTIPLGIAAFAMLNAAFEEVVWRGAVMHALESVFGRGAAACVVQALLFGAWHFYGFPSGWVGSGLAVIFALMMGILRMRGRGMLAPFLAHFVADFTIFVLVAMLVLAS